MPLGGNQLARGDVDIELAELKRLTPIIYAVVDSERNAAGDPPAAERVRFKEACERSKITGSYHGQTRDGELSD